MRTWVAVLALVAASSAWAQKVVVLEIDGDTGNKLHAQVEAALKKAGQVELLSLDKFKEIAAKKKLKGGAAMTAVGVSRVGKVLKLDAAVGGELTATSYKVVIYDRTGQELWTKELTTKKGTLSDDFAAKLARAIAAAGEQGAAKAAQGGGDEGGADSGGPELDLSGGSGNTGTTGGSDDGNRHPVSTGTGGQVGDDPNRDTDLESEGRKKRVKVGPPLVRGWVQGITTWRSQCLRPGVSACREYDGLTAKPEGIVIDFTASVPYLGVAAFLEVFPLANFDNRALQGFGLLGHIAYGSSLTKIVEATAQGNGPEKPVTSVDLSWAVQLAWRFHFGVGYGDPTPTGYVGLKTGLQARTFTIDPNAGVSLPSSQRVAPTGFGFPMVGLEASIPISKYFRIEAGGSLFINPKPSPEQIVGYGNLNDPTGGVTSTGLGFEAGFAGDIWGPIGYSLKLRYASYVDHYYGQGQKWTVCNDQQCGGVSEESFVSLFWGITASY